MAALLASPYTPGLNGIVKRMKGVVYSSANEVNDIQVHGTEAERRLIMSENTVSNTIPSTQVDDETTLS